MGRMAGQPKSTITVVYSFLSTPLFLISAWWDIIQDGQRMFLIISNISNRTLAHGGGFFWLFINFNFCPKVTETWTYFPTLAVPLPLNEACERTWSTWLFRGTKIAVRLVLGKSPGLHRALRKEDGTSVYWLKPHCCVAESPAVYKCTETVSCEMMPLWAIF